MNGIPEPFLRYLRLLGISGRPAGIKGLEEIVLRHLCRIPFENVSKLLLFARENRGRAATLDEFLDGIEYRDLGGTCHSSNPFLAELLKSLGYETVLLGADMTEPDVHTSIRVKIDSVNYHVDMGYAAPFRRPIRLDRLPYEVVQGDFRYVLDRRPDDSRYEISVLAGDERIHGYVVNETPRDPDYFDKTIRESFEPGRAFMTRLRITRFFPEQTIEVRDRTALYFRGGVGRTAGLSDIAELEYVVFKDMQMPRCPVRNAIAVLEGLTGGRFF
jgi:arylamine N-acetyltransferase